MKLREIFAKNIDRKINPAVVVTQLDDNIIKTEIEEYVFTSDLIENLYKFLNDLLFRKDGKTGVWINGYYGSGKSHFLKYSHYCLNSSTSEKAFDHFVENAKEHSDAFSDATQSNIIKLKSRIESSNVDNIMFNIDAVAGQNESQEKITRIILNQFNLFRGYNGKNIQLAKLVEKHLDKLGKFEKFKKRINEQGNYNWDKDAATLASLMLDTVLGVVKELDSTADIDSMRHKLMKPDDISIKGDLIPEFIEYLEDKPDDYRLVFLVDEVSQYIGTNTKLLLNLQTIIEEIGSSCNNRIWFAATAQQTLDQVVDNRDITGEDFGKIMGRFETRISLESQDADYITKIRILSKNSKGIERLETLYNKNKEPIEHQFNFSHDLYKSYESIDEFYLSYPFIPYQFRLISDVFEAFSNLDYVVKEVRDNERSILGITHFTLKNYGDNNLGYFIPFDGFFNDQFKTYLTHTARRIINRANSIEFVKNDTFTQRVVNVLFMVSSLSDPKKIVFPVNLDNLSTLLIEESDTNKLDNQQKIQKVLDKLSQKNIIREEKGQYSFLKEDEIDVSAEIQNNIITSEDRLTALHDDIFSKIINISRKYSFGNNNFNLAISFDDKFIFNQGDVSVKFCFYDKEESSQKALGLSRNDLVFCINDQLQGNKNLLDDFDRFVKTKKYIHKNFDSAVGTRRKTLDTFDARNKNKLSEIRKKFEELFKNVSIISNQRVLDPGEIQISALGARYNEALNVHFESIYKKQSLIKGYAKTNEELSQSANNRQISSDKSLTHAEEAVNNWVGNYGDSVLLDEIIKHFKKPPFGWRDLSTIDVLINLARKDKRRFEWRNDRVNLITFSKKAPSRSEQQTIKVFPVEEVDHIIIQQAIDDYREIFNKSLAEKDEPIRVHQELVKKFNTISEQFKPYADKYNIQPFGRYFLEFVDNLNSISNIREPKRFFDQLNEKKSTLKILSDNCKELQEFVDSQFGNYQVIRDFVHENENNFTNLIETDQKKAEVLQEYFQNVDLPSRRFPQIRQAHKELKQSIVNLKNDIVKQVVNEYTKVYNEIEDKAKKEDVSDKSLYVERENKLNQLKIEKNIAKLKLALAETASFKAKCLKAIDDSIGKKSVTIKIAQSGLPSQIESDEQLEDYLNKLKEKLQKELKAGNTIIIE